MTVHTHPLHHPDHDAIRFETYAEAVEFGSRLAPIVKRAHEHWSCWIGARKDAITVAYQEYGKHTNHKETS